jgi:hypothetical protein
MITLFPDFTFSSLDRLSDPGRRGRIAFLLH